MIYHKCFVALLSAIVTATHLSNREICTGIDEDCVANPCNDLELSRKCGAYDYCMNQAIACGAKKFLVQGSKFLWYHILQELDGHCNNNFEPFKKLYGEPDLVNIKLQVIPGREPLKLSFDFKGDITCINSRHSISVKLNNKVVYDDIDVAKATEPSKHVI